MVSAMMTPLKTGTAQIVEKPARLTRSDFRVFRQIQTRWMDNDVYGHVNNVVYYSWFDTAVNGWLLEAGLLDFVADKVIGLVVETSCTYFESIAYPDAVECGLAIERLGRTSVTYRVAIFRPAETKAAAQGRFTHVYVERATQRPVPVPDRAHAAMLTLV
jgi:acyl-CoA thioester hydrolase